MIILLLWGLFGLPSAAFVAGSMAGYGIIPLVRSLVPK